MSTLTSASPEARDNLRGIVTMLAAMAGFVTNDMFVKLAAESLPTGEVIFLRGLMTTAILVGLAWATGALAAMRRARHRAVALRSIGEAGSTVLYLTALFHIPIADATAILQAMPLIMTIAAALVLRETVRWRRWMAVAAGFIGMLMVVRPGGDAFSIYSLIAVASLAFVALRDLSTRFIPMEVPGLVIGICGSTLVTLSGLAISFGEEWTMPDLRATGFLAAAALCLTAGYFFIVDAMRYGEMSVVAPFRYTIIVWAIAYGFIVWGELPDGPALGGIALIVGSGLFVFYRESRLKRSARAAVRTVTERR